ncbi:MAG: hypothetical protein HY290_14345 [Planctomycetia bacterium]|nr:hypothetical protein [Planctomycetia bacterium]
MTILLPTLAAAFAALCVWLTVRIVNRKEKWAKWTLAGLIGVPVLYVASFGPWLRIYGYANPDYLDAGGFYAPCVKVAYGRCPKWVALIYCDYLSLCVFGKVVD